MAFPTDIAVETKFDLSVSVPKFRLKDLTPYLTDAIALNIVKANFKIVNPLGVVVWNNTSLVTPDVYSFSVSSITRSGSTATVTAATAHGLATGDSVLIQGADQSEYNIQAVVTKLTATTFTYQVSGTPVTPATGTILGLKISLNTISIPLVTGGTMPIEGTYTTTLTTTIASGIYAGTYTNAFSYQYSYTRPTVVVTQSANCFIPRYTSTDATTYTVGGITPDISRAHNIVFPVDSELPTQEGVAQTVIINSPKVWNGVYQTTILTYATYAFSDDLIVYDKISGTQAFTVTCDINLCSVNCVVNSLNAQYKNEQNVNPAQAEQTYAVLNRVVQLAVIFNMNTQCGNADAANQNLTDIYTIAGSNTDCNCSNNGQVLPLNGFVGHTIFDWTDYSEVGLNQYDYVNFENALYQAIEPVQPGESPTTNPEKYQAIS